MKDLTGLGVVVMNKNKTDKCVSILIYLYLTLPTLIFFIGWLKWYWALPLGILTAFACIRGFSDSMKERCLVMDGSIELKTMFIALIIIALWVYLSGIGGYCYQNDDHEIRNTIFRALVQYNWPVVSADGSRGLIYYIGFWLPAACVGKVFGLEAGYAAQAVWAVIGIFIVYYLICVYRKKVDLLPIVFLILFSGLDYIGTWILGEEGADLSLALHLEWWAVDFQFTSMTAQLFWVFNQAIPAWVSIALIMVQKSSRNMPFILSLTMLTSTIPFVGLIPIVIYLYIRFIMEDRKRWKEIITPQNIIGVFVIGASMLLYLIGNISGGMVGVEQTGAYVPEPAARLLRYLLFYFLEFGVYMYFVCKYHKKDPMVWLIVCILVVCPLIKVGSKYDFCMRASVPALFILMLLCMDTFGRIRLDGKKYLFAAYCATLLIGAITAFNEIHRSISETFWRVTYEESVRYPEVRVEDMLRMGNFSGETQDSVFYKYFVKMYPGYSEPE